MPQPQTTITILHGEHTVASRTALAKILDASRASGISIERLQAKTLSEADLETTLGSSDLFGTEKLLVVEELHSLPRSKRKNDLIKQLAASSIPLVLWEKRDLTATMIKQFPGATVEHFKASSSLFTWLQSLGSKQPLKKKLELLHQSIAADSDQFCFIMLCRQVRQLIQIKDAGTIKGHPFAVAQLKKQAALFSLEHLLELHTKLLQIDWTHKTGRATLTMQQELDLLTIQE